MSERKPVTVNAPEIERPAPKGAAYVKGTHASRVRSEHDERRTELLARDEILAGEIQRRQDERDDINEALRLLSDPGTANAKVVAIRQAGE